jgi:capsular polysaccharide biosynthesis protein
VLAIGLITYDRPESSYNAGIRFIAGQEPSPLAVESDEERLANWKTSEYIVNTLSTWVRSGQFAELVSDSLRKEGIEVPAQAIQGGFIADDARSILTVSLTFNDPVNLEKILSMAAVVLINENNQGLPQLGGETAKLVQLDEPIVNRVSPGILNQLDLPFRIGLALAVGVVLALFVDYIDPTIKDGRELEAIGLTIVGAIPGPGGRIFKNR